MKSSTYRPVVFLPGLLCDAVLWRAQIDGLADLAAPLVADLTLDDTIVKMAQRILAVAPPRFALAALSMGGYVAFEILRQAPERVERLALLDTSANPDTETRAAQRRGTIETLAVGYFRGVTSQLLPKLVHADKVEGPVGATVQAMAERVGAKAFIRQQKAILSRPDSRPLLNHIQIPAFVAVGEDDVLTPIADAQTIHAGISGSSFHVFSNCGHLPCLESPTETTRLLRNWLTS